MGRQSELQIGQLAVKSGFITQDDLEECLRAQQTEETKRPLGFILTERGYLSYEQLDELIQMQQKTGGGGSGGAEDKQDSVFAKLALTMKVLTEASMEESQRLVDEARSNGEEVRLVHVLIREGYIPLQHAERIMEYQRTQVLYCEDCDATFNVKSMQPGKKYRCAKCGTVYKAPQEATQIDPARVLTEEFRNEMQLKFSGREGARKSIFMRLSGFLRGSKEK